MSDHDEMARSLGYSPAVRAAGLLFCSGVFGMGSDGSVSIDPDTQYRLAFAALGEVLKAEGCGPADLVELVSYHTSYPSQMDVFMKVKAEFLAGALPAWTAVGVAALGMPATLVEIKAIARTRK